LPNLNFNFQSKEEKEREFRGSGASLRVPPKAVSTTSSVSCHSLEKAGGEISWASAYAPTLPLSSSNVSWAKDDEKGTETVILVNSRNSGSLTEEDES
jgi:hypothetical protein